MLRGTVIQKIVSGGQTGADRAGLDAAVALRLALGGWCPKGRRAEDGPIDAKYPLVETPRSAYTQRTEWNVRDSDATLVLVWERLIPGGGTELTVKLAKKHNKPVLVVDVSEKRSQNTQQCLEDFVSNNSVKVLNIAGPRESTTVPVYEPCLEYLTSHLQRL